MVEFMSARTDGLGQRLKGLLNVISLSARLGGEYKFLWEEKGGRYGKEFHAVGTARTIFSDSFLRDHWVKAQDFDKNQYLLTNTKHPIDQAKLDEVSASGKKGLLVDLIPLDDLVNLDGHNGWGHGYKTAFEKIGFSESVAEAISLAYDAILPERAAAIHIRGGDVVYGPFRKYVRFQSKALPAPVLRELIRRVRNDGMRPVLFMQNPEDRGLYEDIDGVVFASDLLSQKVSGSVCTAMFEIVLISRCLQVYAGTSGFPVVASRISASEFNPIETVYKKEQVYRLLMDAQGMDLPYSDRQKAYSLLILSLSAFKLERYEGLEEILLEGRILDPKNGLFDLLLLRLYVVSGHKAEAEDILRERLSENLDDLGNCAVLMSFCKQCYSVYGARQHLKFLIEAEVGGFSALSLFQHHARRFAKRSVAPEADLSLDSDVLKFTHTFLSKNL